MKISLWRSSWRKLSKIVKCCSSLGQTNPLVFGMMCSAAYSFGHQLQNNQLTELLKVQMNTPFSLVNIWSWAERFSISETASLQESSMNLWVCNCAWLFSHFHISLSNKLLWLCICLECVWLNVLYAQQHVQGCMYVSLMHSNNLWPNSQAKLASF